MSTNPTPAAPGFQPASLPNTADELVGRLLLMQPGEVREFETRHGPSQATLTDIVAVEPDGTPTELGERAIFWQLVRRQLAKATAEQPWIAGRLVLDGQAYRLEAPTVAEAALLAEAVGQLTTA